MIRKSPSSATADSDVRQRRQLAIRYCPVASLKLNPRNPRLHSRRQIRQIARSIDAFGFNVPILVDAEQNVVAGHGRVLASRELGWTEVPTICLDHLTEAQRRAFMIADNRLTEISTWDDRLLAEQVKQLSLCNLDFELDVIGFDVGEIDLRIEGLTAAEEVRKVGPSSCVAPCWPCRMEKQS